MFKKRDKSKFRRRNDDEDADVHEDAEEPVVIRAKNKDSKASSKASKSGNKTPKETKLLSFEDESEENTFPTGMGNKSKKSKKAPLHQHSMKAQRETEKNEPDAEAAGKTQVSKAGTYTSEYLQELQRSQKSIRSGGTSSSAARSEPIIKLSGSFKPMATPDNAVDRISAVAPVASASGRSLEATGRRETADLLQPIDEKDEDMIGQGPGGIKTYDAAAIRAIKEKRERMRNAVAAPEYMPIRSEDGEPSLASQTKNRLDKEADASSGEEDEDGEVRLQFIGSTRKKKAKRAGPVEESVLGPALEDDGAEDDEEEERWMREQLRKGVGGGSVPPEFVPAPQRAQAASWASRGALDPAEGEDAISILRQGVARMEEQHKLAEQQLARTDAALAASMATLETLEAQSKEAAAKYESMQELKAYIADLCECMKEKGALIEELEEHMQRSLEARATSLAERRAGDRVEEGAQADAGISAALSMMSRGESTASMAAAAQTAGQGALLTLEADLGSEVDEFGRDKNLAKRTEMQQRRVARQARRARQAQRRDRRVDGNMLREVGETSSEESEGEQASYQRQLEEVATTARDLFQDTAAEFSELKLVKKRMENWKRGFRRSYDQSYVSMSAPALFAPFVRIELLHWCPLYAAAPLDGMQWYSELVDYGMPGPGEAVPAAADLDENLVPEIMRKVVLPIVQHAVDCWDPLSSRQTESLCACMRELLIYVNPEDDVVQELLETAYKRMVSAAEEVVLPSWPPQAMSVTPGASELAARRYGTAVRLIKNLAAWDMDSSTGKEQIIPRQQLIHLAVDNLVAHRMGPHLMTLAPQDAVFRCERLMSALPESWFADGLPASAAILRDALVVASRPLMGPGAAARGTDTGRRLMKLLGRVGEHIVAKQVAKAYGIREGA